VKRPEPKAYLKGEAFSIDETNFPKHSTSYPPSSTAANEALSTTDDNVSYYILNQEKNVLYIPNFLNDTSTQEIKTFCIDGGRFTRSRIGGYGDGSSTKVEKHDLRTSESCALVPAADYLKNPRWHRMLEQDPLTPQVAKIAREVDLSWDIGVRASGLLGIDANLVEALQVVRYTTPDAEYKLHHDHGGYYGKQTEHRSWTMLIFLNDVVDTGGHTAFPKLDLEVVPREGDALVWSNTIDSQVDRDMVHMGKPPSQEGVEKYAVNVWFGEDLFKNRVNEGSKWE